MLRTWQTKRWQFLAGTAVVALGAMTVYGYERPVQRRAADPSKRVAETGVKHLLKESAKPGHRMTEDTPKMAIESPARAVVRHRTTATAAAEPANPKVAPGKVAWHASFEVACAAAKRSGKPVLLFQMMGKLDDQFC